MNNATGAVISFGGGAARKFFFVSRTVSVVMTHITCDLQVITSFPCLPPQDCTKRDSFDKRFRSSIYKDGW